MIVHFSSLFHSFDKSCRKHRHVRSYCRSMKRGGWVPSSRLVGERLERTQKMKHVSNLLKVKSSVDMREPSSLRYSKGKDAKKKQAAREQKAQIDKENQRLIRKILELDPTQRMRRYKMFNSDAGGRARSMAAASLTRERKRKEKIARENRDLLYRITKAQPSLSMKRMKAEEARRLKLKAQIRQNSMNRKGEELTPRYSPRYTPRSARPSTARRAQGMARPKTASGDKRPSTSGLERPRSAINAGLNAGDSIHNEDWK